MDNITIMTPEGATLMVAQIGVNSIYHNELEGDEYVSLEWEDYEFQRLEVGCYVVYENKVYRLTEPHEPSRRAEDVFVYTPVFYPSQYHWRKAQACFYTYDGDITINKTETSVSVNVNKAITSRELDWSFTGDFKDALSMLLQAIKNETNEVWVAMFPAEIGAKLVKIDAQGLSIFDMLGQIVEQTGKEFWFENSGNTHNIHIGTLEISTSGDHTDGEGRVVLNVGEDITNPNVTSEPKEYFTRFYFFGSNRNIEQPNSITKSSVVNRRLPLNPAKQAAPYADMKAYPQGFIDIDVNPATSYPNGIYTPTLPAYKIFSQSVFFDDIYPHCNYKVKAVEQTEIPVKDEAGKETGERMPIYFVSLYDAADQTKSPIPFNDWVGEVGNVMGSMLPALVPAIAFRSGYLQGLEFDVHYRKAGTKPYSTMANPLQYNCFEVIFDTNSNPRIPNGTIKPLAEDACTLLNIKMPESYIRTAQQELEAKALEYIAEQGKDKSTYDANSDPRMFENCPALLGLEIGAKAKLVYPNGSGVVLSRVVAIERHLDIPSDCKVTLGYRARQGYIQTLRALVEDTSSKTETVMAANNLSQRRINEMHNGFVAQKEAFDSYFDTETGEFDGSHIKPSTVQAGALSVGARNQQFSLSGIGFSCDVVRSNVNNTVTWTAGSLSHYTIQDSGVKTWTITSGTAALTANSLYYIYAKVSRTGSTGTISITTTQYRFDQVANYYYFLIGTVSSRLVSSGTGETTLYCRLFSTSYGTTSINGREITTGAIKSADGSTIFDLDKAEIIGNIRFKSGTQGMTELNNIIGENEAVVAAGEAAGDAQAAAANAAFAAQAAQTAVNNIEIGGRNLLLGVTNPNATPTIYSHTSYECPNAKTVIIEALTKNAGAQVYYHTMIPNYAELVGKTVTFSIEKVIKSNPDSIARVYLYNNGGTLSVAIYSNQDTTNGWRYTFTFPEVPEGTTEVGLIVRANQSNSGGLMEIGDTVTFIGLKLEKGNKATDWSPAPEDTETEIAAANALAETAKTTADAAALELSDYGSDSKISPTEKTALKQQLADINSEYTAITNDAAKYNLTSDTAYTQFVSAKNSAVTALNKYTASTPAHIDIESDYANIAAYYPKRQALLDKIAAAVKTNAKDVYCTCSTAAATQQKAVTVSKGVVDTQDSDSSKIETGATIIVKFTNENTHATPKLKVGSFAAAEVRGEDGTWGVDKNWAAGQICMFTFDGTYWVLNGAEALAAKYGFDNLAIGGRNLFQNTESRHFSLFSSPTVTFTDNVEVTEWNTSKGIRAAGTKGSNNIYGTYQSPTNQHWGAKQYVVSIYIKNLGQTRVAIVQNDNSTKRCVWEVGEEGRKFFVVGSNSTAYNMGFNFVDPDNVSGYAFDFVYWHPKVEEGNVPTDWTPAPEDTEAAIANLGTELKEQIDGKIETWSQSTDPSTDWTTTKLKDSHVGDLWYYTGVTDNSHTNNKTYKYTKSGNTYSWVEYSAGGGDLFDKIDGKTTIYYGATSGSYPDKRVGDFLFDNTTGNEGKSYRWSGTAWVTVQDYQEAIKAGLDSLEIGGKNILRNSADMPYQSSGKGGWRASGGTCAHQTIVNAPMTGLTGAMRCTNGSSVGRVGMATDYVDNTNRYHFEVGQAYIMSAYVRGHFSFFKNLPSTISGSATYVYDEYNDVYTLTSATSGDTNVQTFLENAISETNYTYLAGKSVRISVDITSSNTNNKPRLCLHDKTTGNSLSYKNLAQGHNEWTITFPTIAAGHTVGLILRMHQYQTGGSIAVGDTCKWGNLTMILADNSQYLYLQPIYQSGSVIPSTGMMVIRNLTHQWQKIYMGGVLGGTQAENYSAGYAYLQKASNDGWYEVCGMKLEKGNKVTDWSPAPEDVDAAVAAAQTAANNANSAISNMTDDVVFSKIEKKSFRPEWKNIHGGLTASSTYTSDGSYAKALAAASGTTVETTTLTNAYDALKSFLITWQLDSSTDTGTSSNPFSQSLLGEKTRNYYNAEQAVYDALAEYWSATKAKEATDNLEIGGRNLLRGTQNLTFVSSGGNWNNAKFYKSGTGTIENVQILLAPIPAITNGIKLTTTTANTIIGFAQSGVPLNKKSLTISVWVKGTANDKVVLQPLYSSTSGAEENGNKEFTIPDSDWHLYEWSKTPNYAHQSGIAAGYVYLKSATVGNSCLVCGLKLEYGNKSTDWSPAQEDNEDFVRQQRAEIENGTQYLKDALRGARTGETIMEGGLVLSTMIGVMNQSGNVQAALNGAAANSEPIIMGGMARVSGMPLGTFRVYPDGHLEIHETEVEMIYIDKGEIQFKASTGIRNRITTASMGTSGISTAESTITSGSSTTGSATLIAATTGSAKVITLKEEGTWSEYVPYQNGANTTQKVVEYNKASAMLINSGNLTLTKTGTLVFNAFSVIIENVTDSAISVPSGYNGHTDDGIKLMYKEQYAFFESANISTWVAIGLYANGSLVHAFYSESVGLVTSSKTINIPQVTVTGLPPANYTLAIAVEVNGGSWNTQFEKDPTWETHFVVETNRFSAKTAYRARISSAVTCSYSYEAYQNVMFRDGLFMSKKNTDWIGLDPESRSTGYGMLAAKSSKTNAPLVNLSIGQGSTSATTRFSKSGWLQKIGTLNATTFGLVNMITLIVDVKLENSTANASVLYNPYAQTISVTRNKTGHLTLSHGIGHTNYMVLGSGFQNVTSMTDSKGCYVTFYNRKSASVDIRLANDSSADDSEAYIIIIDFALTKTL